MCVLWQVMRGFGEVEALSKFLHYYERFKGHAESLQVGQGQGPCGEPAGSLTNIALYVIIPTCTSPADPSALSLSPSWSSLFSVQHDTKWLPLLCLSNPWRRPLVRSGFNHDTYRTRSIANSGLSKVASSLVAFIGLYIDRPYCCC